MKKFIMIITVCLSLAMPATLLAATPFRSEEVAAQRIEKLKQWKGLSTGRNPLALCLGEGQSKKSRNNLLYKHFECGLSFGKHLFWIKVSTRNSGWSIKPIKEQ